MVQVLVNTHYHFDHVGSNELLGMRGVRIIAHENVKKRLMTTFENPAMGRRMDALSPAGLPTETFARTSKLDFGRETLEFTHTPLAHTDGDAFVFFPSANVLHTGDLLWTGRYPVVDYTVGGSLAVMAATLVVAQRASTATINKQLIVDFFGFRGTQQERAERFLAPDYVHPRSNRRQRAVPEHEGARLVRVPPAHRVPAAVVLRI